MCDVACGMWGALKVQCPPRICISGEMPLQHYNSTLCLSRVLNEADSCVCFSNDELLTASLKGKARARAGGTRNTVRPAEQAKEQVKISDLNGLIAGSLGGILQPLGGTRGAWCAGSMVANLSPLMETKLIDVWSASERGLLSEKGAGKQAGSVVHARQFECPWDGLSTLLSAHSPMYHTITSGRIR